MTNPTDNMSAWQDEVALIKTAALHYGVDWHFVAAIRLTENGQPGREFGVLSIPAPTYGDQLRICCASVRHRLVEWDQNHAHALEAHECNNEDEVVIYSYAFVAYFGSKWCPVGASNDPQGQNVNWVRNTWYQYLHLVEIDHEEVLLEEIRHPVEGETDDN